MCSSRNLSFNTHSNKWIRSLRWLTLQVMSRCLLVSKTCRFQGKAILCCRSWWLILKAVPKCGIKTFELSSNLIRSPKSKIYTSTRISLMRWLLCFMLNTRRAKRNGSTNGGSYTRISIRSKLGKNNKLKLTKNSLMTRRRIKGSRPGSLHLNRSDPTANKSSTIRTRLCSTSAATQTSRMTRSSSVTMRRSISTTSSKRKTPRWTQDSTSCPSYTTQTPTSSWWRIRSWSSSSSTFPKSTSHSTDSSSCSRRTATSMLRTLTF